MATILCVDDDASVGVVLEHALQKIGHEVILSTCVADATKAIRRMHVDLIVCDYQMPGATGHDLLRQLDEQNYNIPVIMMAGYANIENAVQSMQAGAVDYLPKPIRPETLEIAIQHALELMRLKSENAQFRQELSTLKSQREIVGESDALRKQLDIVQTVAPTRATVLIEGESGTGKELIARAIHEQSPRHDKPFVTLNCAAMPDGLVESELFGHERGAFTGASARKLGAFERAHLGTLVLDEISEMKLELQSKLLRVVQEAEFHRVGGQQLKQVDVRLVATTNRDLKREVSEGRFREDLYFRLDVVSIRPPPLRERLDDIPLLVRHFVKRFAQLNNVPASSVEPETVEYLQGYHWPGNVRELSNTVERAVIMAGGKALTPNLCKVAGPVSPPRRSLSERQSTNGRHSHAPENLNIADNKKGLVKEALRRSKGKRTEAAALLGITDRTLRNMLNKGGLMDEVEDDPGDGE